MSHLVSERLFKSFVYRYSVISVKLMDAHQLLQMKIWVENRSVFHFIPYQPIDSVGFGPVKSVSVDRDKNLYRNKFDVIC